MADPDLDQILRESLIEHQQSFDDIARQEQQDLERAIALSLEHPVADDVAPQLPQQANNASVPNTRKLLEQERLARVAKRSAQNESSFDLEGSPAKRHNAPEEQSIPSSLLQAQPLETSKPTAVSKDARPSSNRSCAPNTRLFNSRLMREYYVLRFG